MDTMSVTHEQYLPRHGDNGRPLRPPWAIAEWAFLGRCDGCAACVEVCREGILFLGPDGRPAVDFSFGGCDFCGACATACDRGALRPGGAYQHAFRYRLEIDDRCLAMAGEFCRTCEEFCDNYAIRFRQDEQGRSQPLVIASQCSGCGACVGPCPVASIHLTRPGPPGHG